MPDRHFCQEGKRATLAHGRVSGFVRDKVDIHVEEGLLWGCLNPNVVRKVYILVRGGDLVWGDRAQEV